MFGRKLTFYMILLKVYLFIGNTLSKLKNKNNNTTDKQRNIYFFVGKMSEKCYL